MKNLEITKKDPPVVLDSRFVKVLAVKRDQLKDALIFVSLDEEKYGHLDQGQLRQLTKDLEALEPNSCWIPMTRKYSMNFIDRAELNNKDLLITASYDTSIVVDTGMVESQFKQAIPSAKSITFVHQQAKIEEI